MGFCRISLNFAFGAFVSGAGFFFTLQEAGLASASPQVSKVAVQAADAAFGGKFSEAGGLAQQADDPAASKLVELIYLRDNWKAAGYRRIMAFLDAAPGWPYA